MGKLMAVGSMIRQDWFRLYAGCMFLLGCQYATNAFPVSFFPAFADDLGFHSMTTGLILAAYPLGMSISSQVAPLIIWRIGTRNTCVLGLSVMAPIIACFGFVPDVADGNDARGVLFFLVQFFAGMCGALPETTCFIMIGSKFKEHSAAAMVGANLACTVGAAIGPLLGASFYELPSDEAWQFRLPGLAVAAMPVLLTFAVPCFMANEHLGRDDPADQPETTKKKVTWKQWFDEARLDPFAPMPKEQDLQDMVRWGGDQLGMAARPAVAAANRGLANARAFLATPPSEFAAAAEVAARKAACLALEEATSCGASICPSWMTCSVFLALASTLLGSALVGTLDSTLSLRLAAVPLVLCYTQISTTWTVSSFVGAGISLLLIPITERVKDNSRKCKLVTAFGYFVMGFGFLILAPMSAAALGGSSTSTLAPADSAAVIYPAMILKSIGNVIAQLCVYPDLMLNVPDDAFLEARVTATYSAMYSLGWAVGPLLGSGLYVGFASVELCLNEDALPPSCPNNSAADFCSSLEADEVSRNAPSAACSCEWQPKNGFDGEATLVGLLGIGYALVLVVAAIFNVGVKLVAATTEDLTEPTAVRRASLTKVRADKGGQLAMADLKRRLKRAEITIDRSMLPVTVSTTAE